MQDVALGLQGSGVAGQTKRTNVGLQGSNAHAVNKKVHDKTRHLPQHRSTFRHPCALLRSAGVDRRGTFGEFE